MSVKKQTKKFFKCLTGNELYSLRLCAVLEITHPADGFGLLTNVTVAPVYHLIVPFFTTSIFCVLESLCQENIRKASEAAKSK